VVNRNNIHHAIKMAASYKQLREYQENLCWSNAPDEKRAALFAAYMLFLELDGLHDFANLSSTFKFIKKEFKLISSESAIASLKAEFCDPDDSDDSDDNDHPPAIGAMDETALLLTVAEIFFNASLKFGVNRWQRLTCVIQLPPKLVKPFNEGGIEQIRGSLAILLTNCLPGRSVCVPESFLNIEVLGDDVEGDLSITFIQDFLPFAIFAWDIQEKLLPQINEKIPTVLLERVEWILLSFEKPLHGPHGGSLRKTSEDLAKRLFEESPNSIEEFKARYEESLGSDFSKLNDGHTDEEWQKGFDEITTLSQKKEVNITIDPTVIVIGAEKDAPAFYCSTEEYDNVADTSTHDGSPVPCTLTITPESLRRIKKSFESGSGCAHTKLKKHIQSLGYTNYFA